MGICSHCGTPFRMTRKSRKYCTNRCRTNACLVKRPRLKQAEVEALHALLTDEFGSVAEMRERLKSILKPRRPILRMVDGYAGIPRLD